nr:2,3-bisphosphoglycerate-independent phosphoglycerate mutase [Tanacetum cinerariifolium]
ATFKSSLISSIQQSHYKTHRNYLCIPNSAKPSSLGALMILYAVEQIGGIYVVTADHGNAEDMVKRNKKGEPILKDGEVQILTSHTL